MMQRVVPTFAVLTSQFFSDFILSLRALFCSSKTNFILPYVFFSESALSEKRITIEQLNEGIWTADNEIKKLQGSERKLRDEVSEKDALIKGLRLSNRVLEEESLRLEEILKKKEAMVCFRVSSLLRSREINLFLNLLIFVF